MSIGQAFLEALESLSGNKLRSGLTVLGIVIGVAAVIAMLAVGRGAQASITGSISGIGTNLLFVFRGDLLRDGVDGIRADERDGAAAETAAGHAAAEHAALRADLLRDVHRPDAVL